MNFTDSDPGNNYDNIKYINMYAYDTVIIYNLHTLFCIKNKDNIRLIIHITYEDISLSTIQSINKLFKNAHIYMFKTTSCQSLITDLLFELYDHRNTSDQICIINKFSKKIYNNNLGYSYIYNPADNYIKQEIYFPMDDEKDIIDNQQNTHLILGIQHLYSTSNIYY